MGPDGLLFIFSLLDEAALLLLAVYFVITLSDLECDYLNARVCCDKLNYWTVLELLCHNVLSLLLLLCGHWLLFLIYSPLGLWLVYKYVKKPSGNIGVFDPTEIHNQKHLKTYMRESLVRLGFHLIFFFVYLYWMIYSLVQGY
ncbi:protein cornichon 4 [Biomphalaria glabrata]|uniref:Protein cornichon homolog 4-like n=2 Tax=Biomphalaria TaxID=6525 RepID=A0A2C9L4C2_BIOGL|nr:protein cornichon homolog 4-like [Biomphalaria glabrata]KAI8741202.1 protein cornichon-like protein 4-like [Biomphalaria glabrata]KAI8787827.1 protein cornichon 4 [Biomphalaria glabrata]KAK0052206.1 protein cornichon 4 [Biomphalaria pfeifferi]